MCGIAGILCFGGKKVERTWLERMAFSLRHRGPDEEGYYLEPAGRCGFAFRRLAIIDLHTGNQPMCNEKENIWIVFNGEIYNFKELRSELTGRGHLFRTRSDTESILHAYEEWGERSLEHLRGMFAFALLDLQKEKIFFARDRVGIKPFYYWVGEDYFAFSSEARAFLSLPSFVPRLNIPALVEYLRYGYVPSPWSIFSGVYKLPPAHFGMIDLSRENRPTPLPVIQRYWKPIWDPAEEHSPEEWTEKLKECWRKVVESHLISDVPLGAFLSGGIDSSSVVAFLAQLAGSEKVKTFSIGYKERLFNELPYSRAVSERYHTDATEEILTLEDLEKVMDTLPEVFDEPFGDPSAVPTFCVSQLAREKVKVALSGDGGDELFAGYGRYRKVLKLNQPSFWRSFFLPSRASPLEIFEKSQRIFSEGDLFHLFRDDYYPFLTPSHYFQKFYEEGENWDVLSRLQHIDLMTYLPENNLTKVDRASMAHGLEVRVPFLDHLFVELAVKVPPELRLKGKQRKYIWRKTMEPYLPRSVLYRKKRGFSIPLRIWMRGDFLGKVQEHLLSPEMGKIFSEQALHYFISAQRKNPRRFSHRLWVLYFFSRWLAHNFSRTPV
ncbi:MAG: asparagine synthase (glutamine-hydrolyzing) [bacterium JZ-2024 1]